MHNLTPEELGERTYKNHPVYIFFFCRYHTVD